MEVDFRTVELKAYQLHQFFYSPIYSTLLSFYRIVVGSKESSITKIFTDANPGSDYDQVYRNNFDENFSINPPFKSRMEKLKNEHHVTAFVTVPDMKKHQLYQSCEVSIGS